MTKTKTTPAKAPAYKLPDGKRAANAARQRAYRQRHLRDPDGPASARLSMVVPASTAARLKRLAAHHGLTLVQALEMALAGAERGTIEGMSAKAEKTYYATTG
jgi:hypothetical protein